MKTREEVWEHYSYMHDFNQRVMFSMEHYHKQFNKQPNGREILDAAQEYSNGEKHKQTAHFAFIAGIQWRTDFSEPKSTNQL